MPVPVPHQGFSLWAEDLQSPMAALLLPRELLLAAVGQARFREPGGERHSSYLSGRLAPSSQAGRRICRGRCSSHRSGTAPSRELQDKTWAQHQRAALGALSFLPCHRGYM